MEFPDDWLRGFSHRAACSLPDRRTPTRSDASTTQTDHFQHRPVAHQRCCTCIPVPHVQQGGRQGGARPAFRPRLRTTGHSAGTPRAIGEARARACTVLVGGRPFVSAATRAFAVGLAALALALPEPGEGRSVGASFDSSRIDIAPHVEEASLRFGVLEHWIVAVIRVESAGQVRAVSSAGAMGLMQLMPGTWARQRQRFGLGSDPFDPRDNILAGTSYLREMYDRYGPWGCLAAYNAGPGRYEDWLAGRRDLPRETRRYVAAVTRLLPRSRRAAASLPADSLPPAALPGDNASAANRNAQRAAPAVPSHPFARPSRLTHDLFAPGVGTQDQ